MDKENLLAQSVAEYQPGQRNTFEIPDAPEQETIKPSLYGIEPPAGRLWGNDLTRKDILQPQDPNKSQAVEIEPVRATRELPRRAQAISKRAIRDRKRNNELKRKALGAIAGIGMAVGSYFASGENQNHMPDGTPKPELRTPDGRATPALEEFLKTQKSR
jgi:uncharacterized protein YcfJ